MVKISSAKTVEFPERNKPGPKPLVPTAKDREIAATMSGLGVPQDGIASLLGIDPDTLRKYFRDDLDRGATEATAKVSKSLFHMATVDKIPAAAIFWMKARAGWRERDREGGGITVNTGGREVTVLPSDPIEAARVYRQLIGNDPKK